MKQFRLRLAGADYQRLCLRVFIRDGWKCRHCKNRNNLNAHHIIFRSQGGDDADWNLVTLCAGLGNPCHDAVHRHDLEILAASGDPSEVVDANGPVKFKRLNGWSPGGK